VGEINKEQK